MRGFGYPYAPKCYKVVRMEDTRTTIGRAFKSAARWQVISTLVLALAALILVGMHAAASVFLGGAAALIGGYAGVVSTRRSSNPTPGTILMSLLKAEAVKVAAIALVLLLVFKFYKGLVPLALISGLAAAVLISGAGLRTLGNENK